MFALIARLLAGRAIWYFVYGAVAATAAGILVGAYYKGRSDCYNATEVAQLKAELRLKEHYIQVLEEDAREAEKDHQYYEKLDAEIKEMQKHITDGDCFSADESNRLRNIF